MKNFNLKFIIPLALTFVLQGCMPDSLTKFQKDAPKKATASATVTSSPSDPPDLTSLSTFQLKNITQKSTSYHLHKYGTGNSVADCEIPIGSLTDGQTLLTDQSNDILCWLEGDETQLFFSGSDFQVNVPAGQCEYVQVKPYYFWNAPPVNTQKIVKTVTCADPTTATCIALGGVSVADATCAGDYTSLGGPNCDEGYVTINSYAVPAAGAAVMTTATNACGGKRTSCYGGPGVDFAVSPTGYPIPINYLAYNGQSINYSVTAPGPLGKGFFSNHYISNFTRTYSTGLDTYDYTTIGSLTGMERFGRNSQTQTLTYTDLLDGTFDTGSGVVTGDDAAVDGALDPLKSADAVLYKTGTTTWITLGTARSFTVQPFYEFSCLNYAHEVKGRIRLQIREWNQKFQTPVASYTEVSESAPTRLLQQSANSTDYETSGVGYWNDISNWDTPFPYGASAAYVPTFPTAVANYGFLFPYLGF